MDSVPTTHQDWINPELDLVGVDGNALSVVGYVAQGLKDAGNSREVIDTYRREALSGDYDNVLRVSMAYAGML